METDTVQLRDQVAALRRRWKVVAIVVILAVALSLALSMRQPSSYGSQATVVLAPNPTSAGSPVSTLSTAQIATESRMVTSTEVAKLVIKQLKLDESPTDLINSTTVTLDANGGAVVTVATTQSTAAKAADVANGFANGYLSLGQQQMSQRASSLADSISSLNNQIGRITTQLARNPTTSQQSALSAQRDGLVAERVVLTQQHANQILSMSQTDSSGQVVVPAVQPSGPSSPKPLRSAILAAAFGLILGIALAYIRDYFDDVIRDESSLRGAIGDTPILGRIPHARVSTRLADQHTPGGEAYRRLGANVRFLLGAVPPQSSTVPRAKVLLVCSGRPGEGTTSTAANLAAAAAGAGLRVVLVDTNLRDPHLATVFGLGDRSGLSDLLAGNSVQDGVLADVGIEGLRVLPAGTTPPNPAELLASPRLQSLIAGLAESADLVVLDSAAVLEVADPLELVPFADQSLLVVREGQTHQRALSDALQRIQQVGAHITGVVYNDVRPGSVGASAPFGVSRPAPRFDSAQHL